MSATTDKASYGPGEVVKVTGTLLNRSATTCTYGASLRFEVRSAAGAPVYGYATHADYVAGQEPTIAPGKSVPTFAAQWDQQVWGGTQGCAPAPSGDYTVVVDVGYGVVDMPVTIRPA